jgi:hypothetical protein
MDAAGFSPEQDWDIFANIPYLCSGSIRILRARNVGSRSLTVGCIILSNRSCHWPIALKSEWCRSFPMAYICLGSSLALLGQVGGKSGGFQCLWTTWKIFRFEKSNLSSRLALMPFDDDWPPVLFPLIILHCLGV